MEVSETKTIEVVLNGERKRIPEGLTIPGLLKWMDDRLRDRQLVSPPDMKLFCVTDDPQEAVEHIVGFNRAHPRCTSQV